MVDDSLKNKILKDFFDSIICHLDESRKNIKQVKTETSFKKIEKNFNLEKISSPKQLKVLIKKYLSGSVKTGNSNFYNQLFSGFSLYGFMGEVVSSATNTSMYTFEMSPVATVMEKQLTKKMSDLIGYTNGGGTFVTGGSSGNMLAMLAARHSFQPEVMTNGLFSSPRMIAFTSEDAHYSMMKAANQIGIGTNNVKKIPVDRNGSMIVKKLKKAIDKSLSNGDFPFFVGATSGTTVRGAFDPLQEIGSICSRYKIWFHIDGSWGGGALLSNKNKSLLAGSKLSDSFSWCAHKMLGVPLTCTAAIFKRPSILSEINQVDEAEYLFHSGENNLLDLGTTSLQCARRVDVLKLWFAWKYFGDEGYERNIDKLFKLAKYASKKVISSEDLKLMNHVEFLNICFQVQPKGIPAEERNKMTLKARNLMIENGGPMVNYAYINSNLVIRLIIVNFELTESHIDQFFEHIDLSIKHLISKKRK